jgi:hypothetical protein
VVNGSRDWGQTSGARVISQDFATCASPSSDFGSAAFPSETQLADF